MKPPWITPYAAERHEGAFAFDGQRIFFPDQEEHRELGVLWQPAPEIKQGEIWWSEMHTGRQRRAMLERLCQVCGEPITSKTTPWIIPGIEVLTARPRGRAFNTATPPTCEPCQGRALIQCPNLSSDSWKGRQMPPPMLLTVRHYRPVAVFGDLVAPGGGLVQTEIPLNSSLLPRMMARHLVVEVFDYTRTRKVVAA